MTRKTGRRVYLDSASATPLSAKVLKVYARALTIFGNPSAAHTEGRAAKEALTAARMQVARSLNVKPEEIVFTSGGTEANNIAIRGVLLAQHALGRLFEDLHCITSTIEHSSVLETFKMLEKQSVSVTYVEPESNGVLSAERILKSLTPNTVLVSLAHVNSELGTVQPIAEVGDGLKKLGHKAVLHADAAQSLLYLEAAPHRLRASLVTYDSQKIFGPKGVGVLYRDFSVPLATTIGGGTQERSIRPGTENVPAIAAAAYAFEDAVKGRKVRAAKVGALRDYLASRITKDVAGAEVLGSMKRRIANNLFITVPGADGDYLAVLMDKEGVAVTPRSACLGSGVGLSQVALALTKDEQKARGTVRMTLLPTTTKGDIDKAVRALKKVLPLALQGS